MKKILAYVLFGATILWLPKSSQADTTTSRFGMTKPDIGSTNWGPKLNTNFDTIDNAGGLTLSNNYSGQATFTSSATFNSEIKITGSTMTFVAAISSGTRMDQSTITAIGAVLNGTRTDNSTVTVTGLINGTRKDNSTTTFSGIDTFATHAGFKNGIDVSTGNANLPALGVWISTITTNIPTYITGATDGSQGGAGFVGEDLSTASAIGQPFSTAASGTYGNVVSLTYTAGSWLFRGCVEIKSNTATMTDITVAISQFSGNTTTDHVSSDNAIEIVRAFGVTDFTTYCVPGWRQNIGSNTIIYLKVRTDYTGQPQVFSGKLSGTRVR